MTLINKSLNKFQKAGISSLTIENFKGISEAVTIPFKPITLIFGANSAGKSTVLHAMAYVRELLERNNPDAGKTLTGGDYLDLGGFVNLVHKHEKDRIIRIRFDYKLDDDGLRSYFAEDSEKESSDIKIDLNALNIESFSLGLEIMYDKQRNIPIVSKYLIALNGEHIAEISSLPGQHPMLKIDFKNEIFSSKGEIDDYGIKEQIEDVYLNSFIEKDDTGPGGVQLSLNYDNGCAIPRLFNPLELHDWPCENGLDRESFNKFSLIISQIIVRPGEYLLKELQKLRYVGPVREIPPRSFLPPRRYDPIRWIDGMAAWDMIYKESENSKSHEFIDDINKYLSNLKLGYRLELQRFKKVPVDSDAMLILQKLKEQADEPEEDIERLLKIINNLSEEAELKIIDEKNGAPVNPQDIGVGVSQVIPVITGAINNRYFSYGEKCRIFAVEQPELHLHPAGQCELMDVFLDQLTNFSDSAPLYLLETHSEHLILRLLRRVRESASDNQNKLFKVNSDNVAIVFVDSNGTETQITNLRISEDGEIIDPWPGGFFPERMNELFGE